MLTFITSITLLRNGIHSHSSRQAGYALSQGFVSAQAVVSLVVPRQISVRPLLRPVRLEYRHLLEAHHRLVPLESNSSDDDCVGHHRVASSPRTIVAAPAYASSLYHDDSCLSPRHVHLVSKVSDRPLGGVYQTLSFDAAYFHTSCAFLASGKYDHCGSSDDGTTGTVVRSFRPISSSAGL